MITRPTLLLDEETCRANIRQMVSKFRRTNVTLRPHFKTHQSRHVGRWFRDEGVDRITVSSVKMAEYFADDDWKNITVAFPFNPNDVKAVNELAKDTILNICVVEQGTVSGLKGDLTNRIGVFIEIDNGYHRTGVDAKDFSTIDRIINEILENPSTTFMGFLAHAGHSYKCRTRGEIINVHNQTTKVMCDLAIRYRPEFPELVISTGDTPTCSVAEDFNGVDEVRPGNFAFYDMMQTEIGSCQPGQIAIAVACPIVAKYPKRNELVIHGGAVHFSKDFIKGQDGTANYGVVGSWENGWWKPDPTSMFLKSLSQEHGIVHAVPEQINSLKIGDLLAVLPIHSCLTADCMKEYTLKNGTVISIMT